MYSMCRHVRVGKVSLVPALLDSGLVRGQVRLAGLGWNGSNGCKVKQGGESSHVSCGMNEFMTNSLETAVTAYNHVTENKDFKFVYQFRLPATPVRKENVLKSALV